MNITALTQTLEQATDDIFDGQLLLTSPTSEIEWYQTLGLISKQQILKPIMKNPLLLSRMIPFSQWNHISSQVHLHAQQLPSKLLMYEVTALNQGRIQPVTNLQVLQLCQKSQPSLA